MYKICARCVMDTTDSRIEFDASGVCDHCRRYDAVILSEWQRTRTPDQQQRLLDGIRAKGRGRDFDCIIGVSGGLDSSYLTYLAAKKFDLRPLIFHVDAGWNSREAVTNIERLVDGLKLDLFTHVVEWDEMRDLQLAFFRSGVSQIDAPQDYAFFASMYRFAVKHDVKHILSGANLSTECVNNPKEWMYYQSDSVQLSAIHRRFGTRPLTTFPRTNILWHKVYLPWVKSIRVVRPLNYVDYVKEDAERLLIDELGWHPYPQKHFESRFTAFYEGFWLYRKFGFDTRRVKYSSLILTGQMTRDAAMELLKRSPLGEETSEREFAFVASKLDISRDELQSYFDAPNRSYRDYPSQAWLYELGGRLATLVGLDPSGAKR